MKVIFKSNEKLEAEGYGFNIDKKHYDIHVYSSGVKLVDKSLGNDDLIEVIDEATKLKWWKTYKVHEYTKKEINNIVVEVKKKFNIDITYEEVE